MRAFILIATLLGFATPSKSASTYILGPTISTTTGIVSESWAGTLYVAASSSTISTPTITLNGVTGEISAIQFNKAINVQSYATGGTGISTNPWTGWDTRTPWASSTTFIFPNGYYLEQSTINFALQGIQLIGLGLPTIRLSTGQPNVITMDAGICAGCSIYNIYMENFVLSGSTTSAVGSQSNGLYLQGIHHSNFKNIHFFDIGQNVLETHFAVLDRFEKLTYSGNEGKMHYNAVNGIVLSSNAANGATTTIIFEDPIIEGILQIGMKIDFGNTIQVRGGAIEAGTNRPLSIGIAISSYSSNDAFYSVDFETNSVADIISSGAYTSFVNIAAAYDGQSNIQITPTAINNKFIGGILGKMYISTGALATEFLFTQLPSGATDYGTKTMYWNNIAGSGGGGNLPLANQLAQNVNCYSDGACDMGNASMRMGTFYGTQFYARDGSTASPSISFINDTGNGFYRPANAESIYIITGSTTLYLAAGKLGVGTPNTPAYPLDVNGAARASGQLIIGGTTTVQGNAFSVGASTLIVANGNMVLGSTLTIQGNAFSVGSSTFVVTGGLVGIGTPSPLAVFHSSTTGTGIQNLALFDNGQAADSNVGSRIGLRGSGGITQSNITSAWSGAATTNAYLSITTRQSNSLIEVMRLDQNGNVGIGTTSPGANLDVNGSAQFGSGATKSTITASGSVQLSSTAILSLGGATIANGTLIVKSTTSENKNPVANFQSNAGSVVLSVAGNGIQNLGCINAATLQTTAPPNHGAANINIVANCTDFDLYSSTGTGTGQWRNTRTGTGP